MIAVYLSPKEDLHSGKQAVGSHSGKHLPNVSGVLAGVGPQTLRSRILIAAKLQGKLSHMYSIQDEHLGGERWARHEVRGKGAMLTFDIS